MESKIRHEKPGESSHFLRVLIILKAYDFILKKVV
jgi:hypothetical protein